MFDPSQLAQIRAIVRAEVDRVAAAIAAGRHRRRPPPPAPLSEPMAATLAAFLVGLDAAVASDLSAQLAPPAGRTQALAKRIAVAMRELGWIHARTMVAGVRCYRYHRPESASPAA